MLSLTVVSDLEQTEGLSVNFGVVNFLNKDYFDNYYQLEEMLDIMLVFDQRTYGIYVEVFVAVTFIHTAPLPTVCVGVVFL
jgi:hypothetical protein